MDFILETPEGIVGLEIKTSQTVTASDCTGLRALSEAARGNHFFGGSFCMGEQI